jgi:drug/metabolite transporter (DMT)-like permease
MKQHVGITYLLAFSIFTGLGTYAVKLTANLNPAQILFSRAVLASLFLFVVAVIGRKLKELKFRMPLLTLIMGTVQGLSIFLFYAALEKTTVTNAVLLTYTAPIFGAILSVIFLREKLEHRTIVAILTSFLGVALVSDLTNFKFGSDQTTGSLLALLGGFFYAAMAISSKSLTQKTTPLYAAFWQYFIIMVLTSFTIFGITAPSITQNILPLVYLGWIAGGIAFLLFMKGASLVKGQIIQIITMTEVVVAGLAATLLLGEPLTQSTIIGGILILSGVAITSFSYQKKPSLTTVNQKSNAQLVRNKISK